MTEEIIIDGVNVSECCFYNNSKCDNPNGMACNCINNTVCYFKELKRLEQENEEQRKKYRSALEEIREIANYMADDSDDFIVCYEGIEEIQNKINEVLNG